MSELLVINKGKDTGVCVKVTMQRIDGDAPSKGKPYR